MGTEHSATKPGVKERAKHELADFARIALYLAFFFCALATYSMLLLRNYDIGDSSLTYTFAIINALVIAKVILIGEMAHLGRGSETRPLYQSAFYKAFVYSLLVLAFHFLEEFIRRVVHGKPFGTVWHEIRLDDLIARSIVVFCAFLPLFAFRELSRVVGQEKLFALFFKSGKERAKGSLLDGPGE